ncbi:MAG: DUF4177 domain-containing protein [Ruegeria sp.]
MQRYEYKVVPAPKKGSKAKGVKTPEGRFANSVQNILNEMGQDGWEYQRAELLPSEERSGLTGSTVNWRNVLVFRRAVEAEVEVGLVATRPEETEIEATPSAVPEPEDEPVTDEIEAPAPIAEEAKDPPLTLKNAEVSSESEAKD